MSKLSELSFLTDKLLLTNTRFSGNREIDVGLLDCSTDLQSILIGIKAGCTLRSMWSSSLNLSFSMKLEG